MKTPLALSILLVLACGSDGNRNGNDPPSGGSQDSTSNGDGSGSGTTGSNGEQGLAGASDGLNGSNGIDGSAADPLGRLGLAQDADPGKRVLFRGLHTMASTIVQGPVTLQTWDYDCFDVGYQFPDDVTPPDSPPVQCEVWITTEGSCRDGLGATEPLFTLAILVPDAYINGYLGTTFWGLPIGPDEILCGGGYNGGSLLAAGWALRP